MKKKQRTLGEMLVGINIAFYTGLAVLILALLLGESGTAVQVLGICTIVGMVLAFGGLLYAFIKFRCPHCNASLMPGRRLPMSVPAYCSHCGAELKENH